MLFIFLGTSSNQKRGRKTARPKEGGDRRSTQKETEENSTNQREEGGKHPPPKGGEGRQYYPKGGGTSPLLLFLDVDIFASPTSFGRYCLPLSSSIRAVSGDSSALLLSVELRRSRRTNGPSEWQKKQLLHKCKVDYQKHGEVVRWNVIITFETCTTKWLMIRQYLRKEIVRNLTDHQQFPSDYYSSTFQINAKERSRIHLFG